jgi:uncharacterized membrane protein
MVSQHTDDTLVFGKVLMKHTEKKPRATLPVSLAITAVVFGLIFNILHWTVLIHLFDTSYSSYYFLTLYDFKEKLLFIPYFASVTINTIAQNTAFGTTYTDQPIIISDIFLTGSLTLDITILIILDIFIGFLQWYWIGRLIVWGKQRFLRR